MQRTTAVTPVCILVCVATLLIGLVEDAQGKHRRRLLNGTYSFSYTRDCTQNVGGFDAELRAVGDAASPLITSAVKGLVTYNGDGTAASESRLVAVLFAPVGSFAATISEFTCAITYVVNPDGGFDESATCTGSFVAGSQSGRTHTQTWSGRHGQISVDGRTLLISDSPSLLTITLDAFPPLGLPGQTFQRICWRSGTAVKIRNDDRGDD